MMMMLVMVTMMVNVCDDDCCLVMKVILVKEGMSCNVSPVAMFRKIKGGKVVVTFEKRKKNNNQINMKI